MFVIYRPIENFSLIWRRHHYWFRAANFDLCSALEAIEQWGFFSVPHLLWHYWASVYNGHLRGPVTHTCCRAFSNGTVTTRFFDLGRSWDSNTQPSACRANVLTHCATAAVRMCRWIKLYLHTCICTSFQQTLIINSVSQNKYSKRLNLLLHNPNTSGIHETFSKIEFI